MSDSKPSLLELAIACRELLKNAEAIRQACDDPNGDGSGRDSKVPGYDEYEALDGALRTLRGIFKRADEAKTEEPNDPLLLVCAISTEHITRETGIRLPELVGPEGKLNGGMTPYGCFLAVAGSAEHAPPDLAAVLTACRDRGFQYVYLDRDALPVDWLPILWVEPPPVDPDPDTLH